ncbi:MAG: TatD family deoxyribonuclease [Phycisphaerales bacterium]|nr:TatD family deoxyribonuclease [Phycisphaerales bacterium]
MIDTHCHLTFPEFDAKVDAVLAAARAVGVHSVITIATTTEDCARTVALAAQHPRLFASAGVHPLYSDRPRDWEVMRLAGAHPKCVAWGELGLDNHHPKPPKDLQRQVLDEQLAHIVEWRLAGLERPVVIHCRKAFAELVPILRASGLPGDRFVFHCFTGNEEDARMALDLGAHISFTGVLTYSNAPEVRRAAALVPLDRVMVETDAPFLSPVPERGTWPNEPRFVVHVAHALAQVHDMKYEALEEQLDRNAVRFFGPALAGDL